MTASRRPVSTCSSTSPTRSAKEVWIVAPETDQSGASHSLTLAEPLRMRELGKRRYAVKGTPTDCVIMGVRYLLVDKPPDLVLSGVNRGQNLADDVNYSGTVAGAIEGVMLGVPSIAMSLVTGPMETGQPIWDTPDAPRRRPRAQAVEGRLARRRRPQRQFSRLRAGCGQRHGGDHARATRPRPAPHRQPPRYPRQALLLGRHQAPPGAGRRRAPIFGRCSRDASR